MRQQNKIYGQMVRQARQAAGLSISELCKRIGWTKSRLSRIECGNRRMTADQYVMLMQAAGVKLNMKSLLPVGEIKNGIAPFDVAPVSTDGSGPSFIAENVEVDWSVTQKAPGSTFVVHMNEAGEQVVGKVLSVRIAL